MPPRINIPTGTRFGKLVVQGRSNKTGKFGQVYFTCLCDCGETNDVRSGHLRQRLIKSCGKCPRESRSITHGMSRSAEHGVWSHLKSRCLNPRDAAYHLYGGRGITVDPAWVNDFAAFYAHVGPRPTPQHTIERIDNNRGYEPGNVKWDTRTAQARNRRSSRMMTLNGETLSAAAWAERLGVSVWNIYARRKLGWSDEQALSRPVRAHHWR